MSGRSRCPERKGNFAGRHRPRESSGLAPYRGLANARIRSCDMRRPVRLRFKKPTKIPAEDTCSNEEFDERRRNSDEESRAADPDNGNFFIDKVVCVKVDAAGNQWSTSRLSVSNNTLSCSLTSPCTITIPPITTTTNDSQSVSQRTIEWTLAGPHTRG